jgi:transcription antitermination factor NusB
MENFSLKSDYPLMRKSRIAALQAIYQYDFFDKAQTLNQILDSLQNSYLQEYNETKIKKILNPEFIKTICSCAIEKKEEFLTEISLHLKDTWKIEELSQNLTIILLLAISEIVSTETELPIILNEYISITKLFENEKDAKFVNSIVEKIGKKIRRI